MATKIIILTLAGVVIFFLGFVVGCWEGQKHQIKKNKEAKMNKEIWISMSIWIAWCHMQEIGEEFYCWEW